MRLITLASLGFILPAAVSGCSGFMKTCKKPYLDTPEKNPRVLADCPGVKGHPGVPLPHLLNYEDGKLHFVNMDPNANLMKECKDFKMDDHAKFTAVCQGKKTEPFDLNTVIGLSKEGGMTTGPCV